MTYLPYIDEQKYLLLKFNELYKLTNKSNKHHSQGKDDDGLMSMYLESDSDEFMQDLDEGCEHNKKKMSKDEKVNEYQVIQLNSYLNKAIEGGKINQERQEEAKKMLLKISDMAS
jgi:hypothetical protein